MLFPSQSSIIPPSVNRDSDPKVSNVCHAMNYDAIRQCLPGCRFTDHAKREMEAEALGPIATEEILAALDSGEIIEEYPDDVPYPSCLILGHTQSGRPLHVVCAPVVEEGRLVIITTYQPDPMRWEPGFRRRKPR
jgi:hypothetical protein